MRLQLLRDTGGCISPFNAWTGIQGLETLQKLKVSIKEPGTDIHFVKIETHGMDKVYPFATALFELHSPERKEAPHEEESFALLVLKGVKEKGKLDWWVENIVFPYKPASYSAPASKDDGHGHAH